MLKPKQQLQDNAINSEADVEIPEEVKSNPIIDIYNAIKRTILSLHEDPDDDTSPTFF